MTQSDIKSKTKWQNVSNIKNSPKKLWTGVLPDLVLSSTEKRSNAVKVCNNEFSLKNPEIFYKKKKNGLFVYL